MNLWLPHPLICYIVSDNGRTAVLDFDAREVCDKFKQLHPRKMTTSGFLVDTKV